MNKDVFSFSSYKSYLRALAGTSGSRRGVRTRFAKALGCQPTYLSQVLNGNADLSLEQADGLSRHLEHSEQERELFLLLVQRERAGTARLREYFLEKIDALRTARLQVTERLKIKDTLSAEEQAIYYSSWAYAAVHISLTVPGLGTRERLAWHLQLPRRRVSQILDFLVSVGLARANDDSYSAGNARIALGSDSPNIIKHHGNWRSQAVASMERQEKSDLHYSAIVSLSRADARRIQEQLLSALKAHREIIAGSPEEEVYCYSLDLFQVGGRGESLGG